MPFSAASKSFSSSLFAFLPDMVNLDFFDVVLIGQEPVSRRGHVDAGLAIFQVNSVVFGDAGYVVHRTLESGVGGYHFGYGRQIPGPLVHHQVDHALTSGSSCAGRGRPAWPVSSLHPRPQGTEP